MQAPEFKSKTEHQKFIKCLKRNNILELTEERIKIVNRGKFHELGFALYLAWIFENKEKKWKDLSYHFVKLGEKHTLFFSKIGNGKILNAYTQGTYVIEDIFEGIPSGNGNCQVCPLYLSFQANRGSVSSEYPQTLTENESLSPPVKRGEDCGKCRETLGMDNRYGKDVLRYKSLIQYRKGRGNHK